MKKFSVNCDFGGQMAPFTIYIGQPEPGHHPLHFQADWLSKQRGGTIPAEVMDAVTKLQELATKNNVLLEELCVYALGSAQEAKEIPKDDRDTDTSDDDIDTDIGDDDGETDTGDDDDNYLEKGK